MANGSKWIRTLSAAESTVFTAIPRDKNYEIVLWDPDAAATAFGAQSLTFSWDDNCGGTSGLEIIAVGWDPTAAGMPFTGETAFHGDSPAHTFLRDPVRVIDNEFAPDRSYRVRLRAKVCDIYNLAVSAWSADDGGGDILPIPSRISTLSSGTFGTAQQSIDVRLPRLQPLSGAFDYVIFSQCSILKGVSGAPCP
jgi:hypothetical protein